jgi:hypothetical protein
MSDAAEKASLGTSLDTDWFCLDTDWMPWSARAEQRPGRTQFPALREFAAGVEALDRCVHTSFCVAFTSAYLAFSSSKPVDPRLSSNIRNCSDES